jgi:NAD(P)-dependent dehydrogenase (short-subunit alcohol dehydrogenase family)
VIADLEEKTAEKVAQEIRGTYNTEALAVKCDVTSWDSQVAAFQAAVAKYGRVDIVIANAGITEIGKFSFPEADAKGVPVKPDLKTIDVNLIGVLYTSHLALFYLAKNPSKNKALVLTGSMASMAGIPFSPMYSTAKHALIGLLRSLVGEGREDVRVNVISPWFTDTRILGPDTRFLIAGLPFTRLSAVTGAIILAATDPDFSTNGAIFSIPDDGEVFRIDRGDVDIYNAGMYKLLIGRINALKTSLGNMNQASLALKQQSGSIKVALLGVIAAVGYGAYTKFSG